MLAVLGRKRWMRGALGLALGALLPLGSALVSTGCEAPITREPDADYDEVSPLIYDYGLVFDCVAETIADEGFQVGRADRDSGTLETMDVPEHDDLMRHVQEGHRIRARVVKTGEKNFIVRLAASKIERDWSSTTVSEWRYLGRDPELLARLKTRFDKEVEKRYKPKADKG